MKSFMEEEKSEWKRKCNPFSFSVFFSFCKGFEAISMTSHSNNEICSEFFLNFRLTPNTLQFTVFWCFDFLLSCFYGSVYVFVFSGKRHVNEDALYGMKSKFSSTLLHPFLLFLPLIVMLWDCLFSSFSPFFCVID